MSERKENRRNYSAKLKRKNDRSYLLVDKQFFKTFLGFN